MTIALLADIHGNLEALRACLQDAHGRGAQRFAFLGDLVGYGADGGAVIDIVASYAERGAVVVKGNHDAAVERNNGHHLDDDAMEAIEWTRANLTAGQRSFLSALPLRVVSEDICYVHSSAAEPERWSYVNSVSTACASIEAAAATWVFCGHTHEQRLYFRTLTGKSAAFDPTPGRNVPVHSRHRWLGVVGSVGQPRDGNPSAAYALFDPATEEITFLRVAYDHLSAAEKIRHAGLPVGLAYRLERGM
jgi:diadenosine tetraphosphatase ApaH/serine/threonine PP2A family protein phosphatase